jgi:1-acyl-sn-glycerol-3-phosphate acyltransferase
LVYSLRAAGFALGEPPVIRGIFTFVVFVAATVVFGGTAAFWSLVRPGSDIVMRLGRIWSRVILAAGGIEPVYEGVEHASRSLPCVFISNHQSAVDIWSLIPALPVATRFVAKRSLFRIPFFGWALAASGFIPIDRKNRAKAVRSLATAAEKVRRGRPVLLFAEGTRSRDGKLAPFKRGAFHLEIAAGVPVVPVAVSGSGWVLRPGGVFRIRRGTVRVSFAPPLDARSYAPDGIDRLSEDVRARIVARLLPEELDPAEAARRRDAR